MEQKLCRKCNRVLPIERFSKLYGRPNFQCKDCAAAYAKRWRAKNPEKARAIDARQWAGNPNKRKASWRKYGITFTPEQYDEMLQRQGGRCLLCPTVPGQTRLHVDHEHAPPFKVRGLLCRACNQMLGLAKDDPDLLRAAAAYLENA